jgi:hypothetical protein
MIAVTSTAHWSGRQAGQFRAGTPVGMLEPESKTTATRIAMPISSKSLSP